MLKLISALVAIPLLGATIGCSSSADQSQSDEQSDPGEVVSGFSEARRAQDIDEALVYVGESVQLDWGPGTTADTLGTGLAWEDAFGIVFTLEDCGEPDPSEDDAADSVRCKYLVESDVALAAGNEPGLVCIDFLVLDGLIMRSEMLGSMPGCEYQFNDDVFDPFNAWVNEVHPESDPRAMYDDRLSDEGIEIWRRYTEEFLKQHADDPAAQSVSTETESTAVVLEATQTEVFEWTLVAGGVGQVPLVADRWGSPVSNGSSFLYEDVADDGSGTPLGLWRSVDGLVWEEIEPPETHFSGLIAAGHEYLMDAQTFPNDCAERCPVWRSSDGLNWSLAETAWTAASGTGTKVLFQDHVWRVDSADTVLQTDAPNLEWGFGPSQVVLEFTDRSVLLGLDHSADHDFAALESTDGTTWTDIEPAPPFVTTYDEYPPQRIPLEAWQCGFAARDSQAMALTPEGTSYRLWTSNDGLDWTGRQLELPHAGVIEHRQESHCVRALGHGWAIVPKRLATPEDILFSIDGIEWHPLTVPANHSDFSAVPLVAGDAVFLVENTATPDILVGTFSDL